MNRSRLRVPLLSIIYLFIVVSAFAQSGSYFMTQYNPAEHNFDNFNYQLYQDSRGVMHIANRRGVLHYDGNDWWLTPVPYSVYCLAGVGDSMYVGGREGFGLLTRGISARSYIPIDTSHRDIQRIAIYKDQGYFITEKELFYFNLADPETVSKINTDALELLDLIHVDNHIYLSTTEGLYEISTGNTLAPIEYGPGGAYFIRKSPSGRILYVTDSSEFYTQYQGKVSKVNFTNRNYLENHTMTEVIWASDSLIAISTLSGGVLFVESTTGETVQIIDYESGLPDNQLYSIYLDQSGSVWASGKILAPTM